MKKKQMDCHQVLKLVHILFYGGLVLLLAAWVAVSVGGEVAPAVPCASLGLLGILGGMIFAFARLRCPRCGKSLCLGGRIPMHLPGFCPNCGERL